MGNWTILEHPDLWRAIQSHSKTHWLTATKHSFAITLSVDNKMVKAIKSDPLLQEEMKVPCANLFNKMIADMSKVTKNQDRYMGELKRLVESGKADKKAVADMGKVTAEVQKQLTSIAAKYEPKMRKAAQDGWDAYVKDKQDLKKFRIKVAVNLAMRTFGVAVNVAKMALAGPPGIVMAVQGTLKDVVVTLHEATLIFRAMDKLQSAIEKDVKALHAKLADGKGKKGEVLKSFVESIVGYCGVTARQTNKNLVYFKDRLAAYKMKSHKMSRKLHVLLEECSEMTKELPDEFSGDVAKIEKEIDKVIDIVRDRMEKLPTYVGFHLDTRKELDALIEDKGLDKLDKWIKRFETVADVGKIATGAAITDINGWKNVDKTLAKASGYLVSLGKAVERHYKGVTKAVEKVAV